MGEGAGDVCKGKGGGRSEKGGDKGLFTDSFKQSYRKLPPDGLAGYREANIHTEPNQSLPNRINTSHRSWSLQILPDIADYDCDDYNMNVVLQLLVGDPEVQKLMHNDLADVSFHDACFPPKKVIIIITIIAYSSYSSSSLHTYHHDHDTGDCFLFCEQSKPTDPE